jgi:hypothetical protein
MWLFYVLSLIPLIIGAIFWLRSKKIVLWEWGIAFGASILLSFIFHVISFWGLTHDNETWSGQIEKITHFPTWVERVVTTHSETDSKGHTRTWTTVSYDTHHEYWRAETNIDSSRNISENMFFDLRNKFGGNVKIQKPWKSGFCSGDPFIYETYNETRYLCPINEHRSFENRVKACPSLYSFPPVPKNSIAIDYPQNNNWFASDRLLGTSKQFIDLFLFDQMNSRLGPTKKVNVIIVGFPARTSQQVALEQQSKWIGGKKNDFVIVFAAGDLITPPEWVSCFGWTESEIAKANLNSVLLRMPVNSGWLSIIENEIKANYQIKEWKKFSYLEIEPPLWTYILFIVFLVITQTGIWVWANVNEVEKSRR